MIRSIYKYVCAALIATTLLAACSDDVSLDDNWQPTPHQVEFSVSDLTPFEHTGGSKTLTITSNIEWTIVDKPDFVTITPASGATGTTTITVTASPYDGIGLRSGDITFGDASAKVFRKKVQVEQEDAIPRMTVVVGGVTFNMIKVEHGTFQMGSESGEADEKPVHSVTISKDYYLGETEVTQALWEAVTGQIPTSGGYGLGDNYPVCYISYEHVQGFITKLNQKTGRKFRMPTEAEWEFAAKGGNKSKGYTYSGSNNIDDVAWYRSNSDGMHPVKTKAPNELGIYDMPGNVSEWCSDWYGFYSSGAVTDPTGATSGSYRVLRGGSWFNDAAGCRSANRGYSVPSSRYYDLGFRLAL